MDKKLRKSIKKEEGNVLFNDALNTFLFMVIWCWTYYGKGPFRQQDRTPDAAITWATLSN